jgi:hypothetical protein
MEEAYFIRNCIRALIRTDFVGDLGGLVCHAGCGSCGGAEEVVLEGLC